MTAMSLTQVRPRALLSGLASFAPGMKALVCRGTGGTSSARYCYSMWLRHLVLAAKHGVRVPVPSLAELGPGESLGIGLAAMLTGTDVYIALDAKKHIAVTRNLAVLENLVSLFTRKTPIPDDQEFPEVQPKIADYRFPGDILNDAILKRSLAEERVTKIRSALMSLETQTSKSGAIQIHYIAPWDADSGSPIGPLDMVLSQAVMEHVEDVEKTYASLYSWLRSGGFMSHNIDYRSHGLTNAWNGHWTIEEWLWRIVKGRRPYLINRKPHSFHTAALVRAGFRIANDLRRKGPLISRERLATRFAALDEDDLSTSGSLIQAIRP